MLSGVGPAGHLAEMGIDVVHDLTGVGRNLRDHPMAMALYEYQGELEDETEAMLQALLRFTTEGSTTRDDMHLGILSVDPAHVPEGLPLDIDRQLHRHFFQCAERPQRRGVETSVQQPG